MEKKPALKDFDLRLTNGRELILSAFLAKDFALSHADLEAQMPPGFDRVTLYRTLKTFVDKGVIHKVLDDGGMAKYALCREACQQHAHQHEHVHFKCTNCGQTLCLDQVQIPRLNLPAGYRPVEASLLVQGLCTGCNR